MDKKKVMIVFISIFLLGTLLRFYDIDRRPIHHDEGVFSSFVVNILTQGYYAYEPEYHGPLMFYISAFFMHLFGVQDFTLRIGSAILGILSILAVFPLRKYLGDVGMLASSFFIASSPALVYYSRFSFHDVPLVFFYLLFIYSFADFFHSGKRINIYVCSALIAFMMSVKEVIYIILPGMVLFSVVFYFYILRKNKKHCISIAGIFQIFIFPIFFYLINALNLLVVLRDKDFVLFASLASLLAVAGIILMLLCRKLSGDFWRSFLLQCAVSFFIAFVIFSANYTAFFTHFEDGMQRGMNTPLKYNLEKVNEQTGHFKPFWYYLKLLYFFESFIFVFGVCAVLMKKKNVFVYLSLFLSAYSILVFSLLSYKTPWHIVYLIIPLSLSAGFFVQRSYDLLVKKKKRFVFLFLAVLFSIFILFVSYQLSFVKYADEEKISYVYVQATDEFRELVKYVVNSSNSFNGVNTSVDILSKEYWPLPWSLRGYNFISWHGKVIDNPSGDIALSSKEDESVVESKLVDYSKREFQIRRGVFLTVFVRNKS